MKKLLPLIIISAALGATWLISKKGAPSRESLLPLSRSVAEQEKGLDRAAAAAFPLSADEERRIGTDIDASISSPPPTPGTPDAALAAGWREFGGDAAASDLVRRFRGRYEFRTTPAGGENAFAVPGGFIYVTLPLLRRLGNDRDALLFVAGHEIGHVELGHCADAYRLTEGAHDPITATVGGVLSIGRLFSEMHFSSTQELEADRFAIRLMRSVHADAHGALRAFDALGLPADADKNTKRNPGTVAGEAVAAYFQTHPGAWERRAAIEREIDSGR
jgi:Zn-dependent protease with chaperone function